MMCYLNWGCAMNGRVARQLRQEVYGDFSHLSRNYVQFTAGKGKRQICCTGKRAEYQERKREYKGDNYA